MLTVNSSLSVIVLTTSVRFAVSLARMQGPAESVRLLVGCRWEASLRTWLHRIATNECRMLRRRKVPLSLEALLEDAATAENRPPEPAAGEPGPEEAALEAETRRSVLAALAGLPDHYRTALLLKDGLGLRAEDVAQAMGITVPAARSILHRARSALRERLAAAADI